MANMTVRARFAETEGFKTFTYKLPGDDMEQTSSSEHVRTNFSSLSCSGLGCSFVFKCSLVFFNVYRFRDSSALLSLSLEYLTAQY